MLLGEIFQVALQAIRANKLRSFLTMLGIIIGVGAVITMVALGSGAQKAVQARLQALGPTLLSIYPGQSFRGGIAIMFDQRVSVTVDDANALARDARYVKGVVPELTRNLQIKFGGQNGNVSIVGTTPNYPIVKNYTFTAGRMFTAGEDEGRRRYAVLGSAIPDMFNRNPAAMIGQEIQIRGIPFEIIGVLSAKGSAGGFGNPDEQILIPLQTGRYRIMGTDRLRSITVDAASVPQMTLAMIEIERVMRREHKVRPGGENDFQIRNQSDILCGHRGGQSVRRRNRHHEHHARVGHGTHARDRRAQGAGRDALQYPVPVPRRGARVVSRGRAYRNRAWLPRRGGAFQARALEHVDQPVRDSDRVYLQRDRGVVLRHLAGPSSRFSRSYRGAAV